MKTLLCSCRDHSTSSNEYSQGKVVHQPHNHLLPQFMFIRFVTWDVSCRLPSRCQAHTELTTLADNALQEVTNRLSDIVTPSHVPKHSRPVTPHGPGPLNHSNSHTSRALRPSSSLSDNSHVRGATATGDDNVLLTEQLTQLQAWAKQTHTRLHR